MSHQVLVSMRQLYGAELAFLGCCSDLGTIVSTLSALVSPDQRTSMASNVVYQVYGADILRVSGLEGISMVITSGLAREGRVRIAS